MNNLKRTYQTFRHILGWGMIASLLTSSILAFFSRLAAYSSGSIISQLGEAVYIAIFGPLLSLLLFGLPGLVICIFNSIVLTILTVQFPRASLDLFLLSGGLLGALSAWGFKIFVLNEILIEQKHCDSVCLGLEQYTFGVPFWYLVILIVFLTGLCQGYKAHKRMVAV